MDCLEAKQKLEPCAKGDLPAAERAELNRHIATCEGCRLELELTRAVLGSSSSSADPLDDPALVDPALDDPVSAGEDRVFLDSIEPGPTIEQERLPQAPPEGPGPPRVLTSQLPEEAEEDLGLDSIHPSNAYDPGAIDLPHPERTLEPASGPRHVTAEPPSESPSSFDEDVSFADPAGDSPSIPGAPAGPSAPAPAAPARAKSGAAASWGFEPVDVPRTSAPPEESLTFAKEALDRKRGKASRGKQQARLLLWIGGAVCGLGLLGASVWMALAFREPGGAQDPANLPAVQPPPGTEPVPAPSDSISSEPEMERVPGMTATDSTPSPQPGSVLRAGAAAGPGGAGGIVPGVAGAKQITSKPAPVAPGAAAPPAASAPSKAPDANTQASKPSASPAPAAEFRADELGPAPPREPRILTVEPDAKPGDPSYGEDEGTAAPEPTKPVITAPIFVPPSPGGSASTGGAARTGSGSASASGAGGSLDRLHAETVAAEKNRDVEALRKLKTSWKSVIRSSTGRERARSKRELADCLWSIQEITKRDADRREALAAYREYVLHAPAGGTDARTVSRMRHLEDILSDAN